MPGVRLHHPHNKGTSRKDRTDRLEQVGFRARPISGMQVAERQAEEKKPMLTNPIRRWVIERHVNRTLKTYLRMVLTR
jgi:hypothetical protein